MQGVELSTTAYIHEGKAYDVSGIGTFPVGTTVTFLMKVGAAAVHFHDLAVGASAGPVTIELIEAPTVSVLGTPFVPINRNRNITNPPMAKVYTGATTTGGDVLYIDVIPDVGGGAHTQGGGAGTSEEFVLKKNTYYAVKLTGTDTVTYSAKFFFYEIEG